MVPGSLTQLISHLAAVGMVSSLRINHSCHIAHVIGIDMLGPQFGLKFCCLGSMGVCEGSRLGVKSADQGARPGKNFLLAENS